MKTKALKFSLLLVVAIVVVVGAARTSLGEQRMRHRRARRSGTLLTLKVNKIHSVFSLSSLPQKSEHKLAIELTIYVSARWVGLNNGKEGKGLPF